MSKQKLKMCLKTSKGKKVTYSLIYVFALFVRVKKENRKNKIRKREKSSQGNVLKENQKNEKSPYKVMY